jgi:hypothetical protein
MEPEAPKPKKKLKVVLISVMTLFFIVFCYLDFFADLLNLYALVAKFSFLLLAYLVLMIYQNIFEPKKVWEQIFLTIALVLFVGFNAHEDLKKYNDSVCREKFGKEFNQLRQSLGIPMIPADWKIKRAASGSAEWQKKDSTGHYWKLTFIDSTCALDFERDEYNLKRAHGVTRRISIVSTFARGKGKGTVRFDYEVGDSTHTITRQQADSILTAEKIQKDY